MFYKSSKKEGRKDEGCKSVKLRAGCVRWLRVTPKFHFRDCFFAFNFYFLTLEMLNRFSQTASKSTAASFIRLSSARTVSNPCQSASSTPTRNLTTSRDISFKPSSISTRSYATQSDTLPSNMSIEESMRTKLQKELDPIKLNIRNE